MWLIDTSTLKLRFVHDPEGLDYVILSHVWDQGQELTFQEMQAGIGKEKPGYDKIVKFCEEATRNGKPFGWVDTCWYGCSWF
jgi:hypothetical protein